MEGSLKKLLFFGTFFIIVRVMHQTVYTHYIHQYILITNLKMNWTEAQRYCRAEYSDLGTMLDEQDISRVDDMAKGLEMAFWIGLYDDINSWRWSLLGEHFYSETGESYRQWQGNQPDNAGAAEGCVSMMEDGFWRDNSCTLVKMPLICFRDDSEDRYVLVTQHKSWFEAQSYCRLHHTDLVSVRSPAENQELRSRMQGSHAVQEAWIGLRRESWKWSDGDSSVFRQWSGNQPNNENNSQACVTMQKGNWNDWNCSAKFNVLCQNITSVTEPVTIRQGAQRRTTVKVKLLTKADPKDPTVTQKILQQLEAAFHLHGFTDVKLHLRILRSEPQPALRNACGELIKKNFN